MPFRELPRYAAWRHSGARDGFEVAFLDARADGYLLEGETAAVEGSEAWAVRYAISLDSNWHTQLARVSGRTASGRHELTLEADGAGRWQVNGQGAPALDGCLDVDLESSSLTNAFPVHRLGLAVGEEADAPAAYVRALDLSVQQLEQRYLRLDDEGPGARYHYASPRFGFEAELSYDEHGVVVEYPGIAVRVA